MSDKQNVSSVNPQPTLLGNPSLTENRTPIPISKSQRSKIRRESKMGIDSLPFTFSKPKRHRSYIWGYNCQNCSREFSLLESTCAVICGECKNLVAVDKDKRWLRHG